MDEIIQLYEQSTGLIYNGNGLNRDDLVVPGPSRSRSRSSSVVDDIDNEVLDPDWQENGDDESDIDEEMIVNEESEDEEDEEESVEETREWTNTHSDVSVDDFTQESGPSHSLPFDAGVLDYLHLFLPETFFEDVAHETNRYATQKQDKSNKRDKYWKEVTVREIILFFAINITMGIIKLPTLDLYWSSDPFFRQPAVADLMGRTRYAKISQYFHMNDSETFIPRGEPGHDPVHKVRPMLDLVLQGCQTSLKPWREISLDEAMISYNGRLSFKQYIKNKPTPWGIKVWCVSCSHTGYLLNFEVYTGKITAPMPHGTGHYVISKLGQPYLNVNHHFFFDRYFASVQLAEDLLRQKTYSCCTIMANRKGWPAPLKPAAIKKKKLKRGDAQMMQKGNLIATVWQDKRQVVLLTTNCNAGFVNVSRRAPGGPKEIKIPTPVDVYNKWMGGVDLTDQLHSYYAVGRKSRKWWRYLCWFLFDVAITNAWILWKSSHQPKPKGRDALSQLTFRKELVKLLCQHPVRKRKAQEIPTVKGRVSEAHQGVRLVGRKKTCYQCSKDKRRNPTGRTPETVWGCSTCSVHLCKGYCFGKFHDELSQ